jgi:PEP-CTERM/exosortase A-associated glycosyltransferase
MLPNEVEQFDGLTLYRTMNHASSALPFLREVQLIRQLQNRILEVIQREQPDIIHAHSPSLNGIAALRAARAHRIPVVYEVRAFWEDAAVDQGKWGEQSFRYRISKLVETYLLRRVDAIFTICEGLKRDIVQRGVAGKPITVIRNCVDSRHFAPRLPDADLAEKLGLQGQTVLGFIGSFFDFEGVDVLLAAYSRMLAQGVKARLLLVGDGIERTNLEAKARALGLADKVVFTGLVPHEDILRYYSVIDIFVYPRKSLRITELVTPLKPLEAMAMEKLVTGSDVGGIRELVTDGVTGFLFRAGDADDMASVLMRVMEDRESHDRVRKAAMRQIEQAHNWANAVSQYLPVYELLVSQLRK